MTEAQLPEVKMLWTGEHLECYANDLLVARNEEGAWVSLAPGWVVKNNASCSKVFITHDGTTLEYGVPKRNRKQMIVTTLEEPTVSLGGEPRWQVNGERQRYAQRMLKEIGYGRIFAAATQVLVDRKLKAGEIGPDDEISPTQEVIAWCDLRQLRLLRKIATGMIAGKETLH